MLKFKNKIFKMLFVFVFFSMVIFSNTIYAKIMTLDFNGIGTDKVDRANRDLSIWKVSDRIYSEEERQKLVKDLEGKSLEDLKGYPLNRYKTDSEGKLVLDLGSGTYYVRVDSKKGSGDIYPFAFVVDDKRDEDVIYPKGHGDTPPGSVELLKLSKDRLPLPGAVFKLYKLIDGKEVPIRSSSDSYNFVTDAKGKIYVSNLEPGDYVFEEVQAPSGYKIRDPKTYFSISSSGTTYLEIYNYKEEEGGKKFKKISSKTEEGLAGAEFIVTKKVDKSYERVKVNGKDLVVVSDKDGFFRVDNLEYGEYYLWETKPPVGYEGLSTGIRFVVDDDSFSKDLYIKNKPTYEEPKPNPNPDNPKHEDTPGPKPPIKIPKTGDINLIVMICAGFISFILGIKMVKENK
ncbi:MSCRAMM family protein [Peptoniphilus catoniae]|uniref:MSCRAMM family protein n=1 Tax=Peptoniphilus catoniae TaxID=1660341 RepID=UPI0010FE343E|nr:SpaA isopeptide-forming pilin-related protein [Peptoniphilus catoniae]